MRKRRDLVRDVHRACTVDVGLSYPLKAIEIRFDRRVLAVVVVEPLDLPVAVSPLVGSVAEGVGRAAAARLSSRDELRSLKTTE